jgi:DNA repair exonuclease SbcCD ATPase subunit
MWIERLDVRGFRHLRGGFTLARGLTVVTGPNEAGKSTLHELLMRILFGFSAPERRRTGGESHKDRCRPWDGGSFGANATLRDVRDGRSLLVEWDFERHAVVLRDQDTGEDLSAGVRRKRDDVELGELLLGIGLEQFRDVCCLHQAAIRPVVGSEPLKLVLRKSIETGTPDIGVEDADTRLTTYLREKLGVHSGHYGLLAKGALATLEAERGDLQTGLERCEDARAEIADLAKHLAEKRTAREELAADLDRTQQALLLLELRMLQARLETARRLRQQSAERPEDPVEVPQRLAQEVRDRRSELARLNEQIRGLERQVESRRDEVASRREEEARLRREADALSLYADVDASKDDQVRTLAARLEAFGPRPRPTIPERDPPIERFRRERSRLLELAGAGAAPSFDPVRLVLAAVVAAVSAGLGVSVHPVAFGGLVLAAVLAVTARRADGSVGRELEATLRELGASTLDELERLAEKEDRRLAGAEAQVRRWEEERQLHAEAEREVHQALEAAGAPVREALAERASAYLTACEKHRRLAELEGQLARLAGEGALSDQPGRDLEQRRGELAEVEEALTAACAKLGIDSVDLERAGQEFEALTRRAEADADRMQRAHTARRELAVLLDGASVAELERRVDMARQLHREHVARVGELVSEPGDPGELREAASNLDGQLRELDLQTEGLSTRIAEREDQLPDPGELRRRLDELDRRIERMRRACEAIRIAREELDAAAREAHRAVAPHLRHALERNLPRITGGRYTSATIDEDLQIQVVAPETGRLVRAEVLSRGTQDQIFLVERLEIARLLDPTTGEAPLLLDDPFDHFDDDRLRRGLALLAEVAAERQVVLFAEESDIVRRAREVCDDCDVMELPGPMAQQRPDAPQRSAADGVGNASSSLEPPP